MRTPHLHLPAIFTPKRYKFLHSQKVFDPRDLPYNTQLVPLAAILTALGDLAHTDGVRRKLSQWYWCGVFGELYGSAVESRFALDLTQVLDWIDGGPEPATVRDASFVPNRLLTLRTRNSAAYKGLSAILMREGCQDFRSGSSIDETLYFDERVDIHHLFPRDYCKKAGIEAARRESVVNKTPLSAKTHRTIGWNRPSIYLNALQRRDKLSPARVDQILFTHLIDPTLFRSDDFDAFFEARKSALLQRVAIAMGKPIREESEQLDLSVLSSEELHLDDEYEDDSPQLIEEDEGNETKQPRKWDEPSFMAEMATRGEKELTSSRQILEWGKKKGCRIWWGKGITNDGSYYLMLDYGGIGHPICGVRTGSSQARVEFPFRDMRLQPPFDNRAKREEFRQKLNVVEGINLNSDSLDRYPRILLSEITSEEALESFLATLDWVITEIRGFDVSIAGTGR